MWGYWLLGILVVGGPWLLGILVCASLFAGDTGVGVTGDTGVGVPGYWVYWCGGLLVTGDTGVAGY